MQRFSHRERVLLGYSPPKTPVTDSDIDFNDVFGGPPRRSSIQETRHRFSEDTDSYPSSGFRSSDESEKPVFGEEGMNRRRQSRTDFYDDIFGGNDRSLSSSPRKYEMKDPFAFSSPARLAEPFATSLPTRFSFMNKGMDLPTFGSPTRSNKDGSSNGSTSPLSGQENQHKNDFHSSSRFSALSQELSTGKEAEDPISLTKNDETESTTGGRFHFPVYKREGKGRNGILEERDKLQRRSSAKGWIPMESKPFRVERDDNGILSSPFDSRNGDGERVPSIREDNTLKSEPQNELCDKQENETKKAHPQTLKMLFHKDDHHERGNDGTKDISGKSRKKLYEILDDENGKKPDTTKRATSNNMEAGRTRGKASPRNSGDNGKGRVRGKVKDFIKIFNQDASSKPKPPETHTMKPEYEPSDVMTETEVKFHMPDMQEQKSSPQVTIVNPMFNGAAEKNTNISVTDPDPTDSVDDNFMIEDLTPEEKIFPDLGIDPEEIKAIDAKIQQWSSGKEGNIRSLLSTLQYVLWPNSGWKAVPLVDIIEGPAVKRSYQKALLCLHPDKLQQKGAASDIKYIAERVFDVLQEAWTHFNSLGSV
ncbi:J-domain protein required for chloroplast accumulation response 1, AUXILIN-LIKE6 [Hibiscus trionum]|uniref:J-domain protein required for chloroplast accumulation response 1, AUXILIN-LIKE6 n=1 Tax=Hibiscus trionum TaxID=183268 RepID=A0A9W7IKK1_HIBTR|nr:J-domain protein required for chloroplast accumulation response 1, AUXILIN-LIKE6 [Hibiscus trionum]